MKRLGVILAAVAVSLLTGTGSAWANESDPDRLDYKIVVWQMPSWDLPGPTWPQTYVSSYESSSKSLYGVELPDCGFFQVDAYYYASEENAALVDALIEGGVLNGPNDPIKEPVANAKLFNNGECPTEVVVPTLKATVVCDSASVFVPKVTGVTWFWSSSAAGEGTPTKLTTDGEKNTIHFILNPGDTNEQWWIKVTAEADEGFTLKEGSKTEFDFGGTVKPCP